MLGLFTYADALAEGYDRNEIRRRVRRGDWVRLRRNVYGDSKILDAARLDPVTSHALDCRAAIKALKVRTVASDRSAALLHGMALLTEPSVVTLTTERPPRSGSRRMPGVMVYTAGLSARHCTMRYDVPVTTAARTVVDLGRHLPFSEALVAADSALHEGLVHPQDLVETLEDCSTWPLAAGAAEVIAFADAKCESPLESLSRVCFADQELPPPESQVVIGGARVDFLWKKFRTIVEADGMQKYDDLEVLRREKRREDRLRDLGYEVVRITWADVMYNPEDVARRIRAAFARGLRRTAS